MCSFLLSSLILQNLNFLNFFMQKRGPDDTTHVVRNGYSFVHNLLHMTGERVLQPLSYRKVPATSLDSSTVTSSSSSDSDSSNSILDSDSDSSDSGEASSARDRVHILFNGEIYNFREVQERYFPRDFTKPRCLNLNEDGTLKEAPINSASPPITSFLSPQLKEMRSWPERDLLPLNYGTNSNLNQKGPSSS